MGRLKIIKVPLQEKAPDYPINFPPLPELYLGMLENRDKVKKEYLDGTKKYVPQIKPRKVIFKDNQPKKDEEEDDIKSTKSIESEEPIDEDDVEAVIARDLGPSKKKKLKDIPDIRENLPKSIEEKKNVPRSLEQLERDGHVPVVDDKGNMHTGIPNISSPSVEEGDVSREKRRLLMKFELLRQEYPNARISIPTDVDMYTDIKKMREMYEDTITRLSLDASVNKYRKFLIMGFALVEWLGTRVLKMDMAGFTSNQMSMMGDDYDRLLIEIGESHNAGGKSNIAPEFRLLFTIVVNAAIFLVGKIFLGNTGPGLGSLFSKLIGGGGDGAFGGLFGGGTKSGNEQREKRKMRGPKPLDDEK